MAPLSPPSRYRLAIWPALDEVIMIALAAKPNGRFQSVAAFAVALTRALELADSDATVNGRVSAHVPAIRRFTQSKELLETPESVPAAITEATTIPVSAGVRPAGSARSPAAWWSAKSNRRRWIATAGAVAMLAITLLGGGSLVIMNTLQHAFGSGPPGPSTSAPSGGVPAATVTAISAALATAIAQQTPGAAATATALTTPHAGATPGQTPLAQPTATAVPGVPLQISPMPLVLMSSQADPETCLGTQRITNVVTEVVGWAWQNSFTQGDVHFQLNGQQVNAPPSDLGMAPSGQDTLTITAHCTAPSQSFAILVKDTLGNPYTFELTVQ
jgi:hypothetical protein